MEERGPYDPKYLQVIYTSLLMMQIVIVNVVLYAAPDQMSLKIHWPNFEIIAVPILAFVLVVLGNLAWSKGMQTISYQESIDDKLKTLTNIHIARWIAVELASMILLTYTLVDSNFYYFQFALVNIIYFLTLRPKIFSFT
jgi:hypothetical protein